MGNEQLIRFKHRVTIGAVAGLAVPVLLAFGATAAARAAAAPTHGAAAVAAPQAIMAQVGAVTSLTARAEGTTMTVGWVAPAGATNVTVRISTEARLGNGHTTPEIVRTAPAAMGGVVATAVPAGAWYLVKATDVATDGTSADATVSCLSVAPTNLALTAPKRAKVNKILRVSGLITTGAGSFPARGKVRAYRWWWNGKRWILKSYADVPISVGRSIGAASSFTVKYKPRLKGYWNFTVQPKYHQGFKGGKALYSKPIWVY